MIILEVFQLPKMFTEILRFKSQTYQLYKSSEERKKLLPEIEKFRDLNLNFTK